MKSFLPFSVAGSKIETTRTRRSASLQNAKFCVGRSMFKRRIAPRLVITAAAEKLFHFIFLELPAHPIQSRIHRARFHIQTATRVTNGF